MRERTGVGEKGEREKERERKKVLMAVVSACVA